MRKFLILLMLFLAAPMGVAGNMPDDDDKDKVPAWQQVRRLHPERERAKAMKKLQEQMSRRAEEKADPWNTSDDAWGTVDLPPSMRDSTAVEGRRLTSPPAADDEMQRLVWRDEPVTATIEQLMATMTVVDGEWRSRYITGDSVGNEVYFAFYLDEDSVPGPLRLSVRYCGDNPVDYDQIVFTIDGHDYTFYPAEPRHGMQQGDLWWAASDDELNPAYRDLVYALAHGSWMMMKLQGMGGVSRVKVLTDGQRSDFADTLALFLLLGGNVSD